jgi:hypothetical protein
MMSNQLGPNDLELLTTVQRRQLATPLLLFLAAHRPLTFTGGQVLYVLAPLCALLGWEGVEKWASLLSAPDANRRLTLLLTALLSATQPAKTPN